MLWTRGAACVMRLLVLGFAVALLMLAVVLGARANSAPPVSSSMAGIAISSLAVTPADAVCADGRMTLESIINQAVAIEAGGKVGKMINVLDRAPGGASVLYIVFEKVGAGSIFLFQDGCLVMFSEAMPGDKILEITGKGSRADAFGGKGI